jgi:hypothetical protein
MTAFAAMKSGPTPVTRTRTLPSSIKRSSLGLTASKISGWGSGIDILSPSDPDRTKRTSCPAVTANFPSLMVPTRILGPCKSCRMPIGRPTFSSSARMEAWTLAWSSWVPWLKLSRNVSTPARKSASSISGDPLAGPTVATILARRVRRIVQSAAWPPLVIRTALMSLTLVPVGPVRMRSPIPAKKL